MTTQSHSITLTVPPEPTDHLEGSEHARVTLVEYGDFELSQLQGRGGDAETVARAISQQNSFHISQLPASGKRIRTRCWRPRPRRPRRRRAKFWPMHDLLFQNQAHLKDKDLHRYAVDLGLDLARYTAEMDDHIYLQRVREHVEGGRRSHIRATPTFFVDGVVQDISFGMKALHDAVASAVGRGV